MRNKLVANGNGNGHTSTKSVLVVLASTGILGVMASGMISIANDAKIAIQVAEQHGDELLLIRGELHALRTEMLERTANRFTSQDAANHEKFIEARIDHLEQQLDRLEKQLN